MDHSINHVAIIMDGNGRWAKQKFRPRVWGHIRGSSVVSQIVESASNAGLKALTLYTFSTENWSRPANEISTLFKLLYKFLKKEKENILKNNIQFKVIGCIERLDPKIQNLINEVEAQSKDATGLILSFAFSYGGRQEIVDSINQFIEKNPGKPISEEDITRHLYRPAAGDVDLMIRTAGDQRISNFLLWQASYSELYFTDIKWPDFSAKHFESILSEVSSRDRRFGSLDNQGSIMNTKKLVHENFNKEI
jgi:undecaprenyl diphosphate synthase